MTSSTWKPAGARLWRPGPVTAAQRGQIKAMLAAAFAARQENARPQPAGATRASREGKK